jgi:hypothetical protein
VTTSSRKVSLAPVIKNGLPGEKTDENRKKILFNYSSINPFFDYKIARYF